MTTNCNYFIIRGKVTLKLIQILKLVTNGAHLPLYQSSAGLLGFDTLLGQTTAVNYTLRDTKVQILLIFLNSHVNLVQKIWIFDHIAG